MTDCTLNPFRFTNALYYAFTPTPKVARVASGRIIASEPIRQKLVRHACSGDRALESGTPLVTQAREKAIEAFVQLIAPHVVKTRLPILLRVFCPPTSPFVDVMDMIYHRSQL